MTLELVRAALLGALQGATEFLPVSSSGHLVVVPALLDWPLPSLAFDTAVHMSTALAVVFHFRHAWSSLLRESARALRAGSPLASDDFRVLVLLAVATVPAAAAGVLLHDGFASLFAMPRLAAATLLITAALLVVAEKLGDQHRAMAEMGPGAASLIGIGQAIAIVPGISRSGATIAVGQLTGLDRESATRFSFLMAAPILLGAGLYEILRFGGETPTTDEWLAIGVGSASAFLVGFLSIGWLLSYVNRGTLVPFALYTALLGIIGLIVLG